MVSRRTSGALIGGPSWSSISIIGRSLRAAVGGRHEIERAPISVVGEATTCRRLRCSERAKEWRVTREFRVGRREERPRRAGGDFPLGADHGLGAGEQQRGGKS